MISDYFAKLCTDNLSVKSNTEWSPRKKKKLMKIMYIGLFMSLDKVCPHISVQSGINIQ